MNRTMEAIVWAMNARGLTLPAWKVNVFLARKVGKRGFDVWPAHKSLAEDCEMSVSSVRRALAELEEGGWIKISPRLDSAGDRTSNLYTLQVRTKMTFPRDELEITPDDADHDPSIPPGGSVLSEHTPLQKERTVRSNRADGLFTGEQGMIPEEPIPVEENPPSPDGEGTPTGDLFGAAPPEPEPPSLADYVLARWHELKADEPGVVDPEFITPTQEKKIVARAAEVVRGREKAKLNVPTPEAVWDELFVRIRASTFLCGRAPPGKGRTGPFKLRLDYALRASEFPNILNGAYDDDHRYRNKTGFDYDTGRPISSAEQAVRGAIGRLGASGQFRAGRGDPRGANASGPHGAAHRPPALPGRSGAAGD
jgi:hypothetical protein